MKLKNWQKRRKVPKVLIPTISALIGAVGAAILKDYFRLSLSEGLIAHSTQVILLFILVTNLAIITIIKTIYDDVSDLYGIRVKYLDFEKDGEVATYAEITRIVEKAEESIWMVNSYLPETHPREEDTKDQAEQEQRRKAAQVRYEYYKTLLTKASQGTEYLRIQQCEDNDLVSLLTGDKERLNHFHELINARDKGQTQISVWRVPATRPITFIIVDGTKLVWQVTEVESSQGKKMMRPYGAFIFEDERQRLIAHFIEYVKRLNTIHAVSIEPDMLPPPVTDTTHSLGYERPEPPS